jgi:hypothetical protein
MNMSAIIKDIVILGCGPAGLSAAINAKIRNRDLLVLGTENCSPPLHKAQRIDNYLGFHGVKGGEPPDKPDQPDRPNKPGGGAESPGAGSLQVYSTASGRHFAQGSQPAAQINIFGDNKRIAPGMRGTYRFTVDNRANDFGVHFDINLLESNNSLNIPMRYRLMDDDTKSYLTADILWHTPAEINQATANPDQPLSMKEKSQNTYTLEWFWDDRGQIDNSWGEKHAGEVVCTLTIKVSAQRI